MDNVTPSLLEKIMEEYSELVASDTWTKSFMKRVSENRATAQDASLYARYLGENASKSLVNNLTAETLPNSTLYYNIAEGTIQPLMKDVWKQSNTVAKTVQNAVNKANGDSLKAIGGEFPEERIESLISAASASGIDIAESQRILGDPLANICQSFYDDFVTANAKKISSSGAARATITRTAESGACNWCRNLAGSWKYGEQPDDVFRRHDNCRCMVTYKTDKYKQDVWTKATWDDNGERAKSIQDKVRQKEIDDAIKAENRVTKASAVEKIQQELHYSPKASSWYYNAHKSEIEKYGLNYVIDYYRNKQGG